MVVKKSTITEGVVIWIGNLFYSYDNVILKERFMCIIDVDKDNLYLLPMSTFKDKDRNKILSSKVNFEYSKNHGNTENGYIKCNQIYVLKIKDFDKKSEIKIKHEMKNDYFQSLMGHIYCLTKTNNFRKIDIKFYNYQENRINNEELKKENF